MCEQTIANRCSRTTFSLKLKSWSGKAAAVQVNNNQRESKRRRLRGLRSFQWIQQRDTVVLPQQGQQTFIACSCFQMCCQRSAAEAQRRCLSTMESFGIKKSTKNMFERRQAETSSRAWHRKSSRSSLVIWTTVSSSSSSSSSQEISQI